MCARYLLLLRARVPAVRCAMILAGIFVKRARLRQGFDRLLKLRVVFQIDLVAFGQAEH